MILNKSFTLADLFADLKSAAFGNDNLHLMLDYQESEFKTLCDVTREYAAGYLSAFFNSNEIFISEFNQTNNNNNIEIIGYIDNQKNNFKIELINLYA